jgi:hypothetical protein
MRVVKIIIGSVLIFLATGLSALRQADMSWTSPEIKSKVNLTFVQDYIEESEILLPKLPTIRKGSSLSFALSSFNRFKHSFQNFVGKSEPDNLFFRYDTTQNRLSPHRPVRSSLLMRLHSGFESQFSTSDYENVFLYNGIYISGTVEDNLQFYTYWWDGHFRGDHEYALQSSPIVRGWYKSPKHHGRLYMNELWAKLSYVSPHAKLSVGRSRHEIGSNIGGSIILNNESTNYGYFSAEFALGHFELSLLHATLIPDSTLAEMEDYSLYYANMLYDNKYLVTHKLDWYPSDKLHLFAGEVITYGNRSLDINYLIPHTFWRIIEHRQHDRDKVMIYSGMTYKANENWTIYGNFSLDDFSSSEIFGNWWGNKYAIQIGNAFKLKDIRTVFEFTAVRPWMYTHKTLTTKYTHDSIALGFPAGANLIQFANEMNIPISAALSLDILNSFTRQGSLGADPHENYADRPKDTANWLEGEKHNYWQTTVAATCILSPHHRFKIGYSYNEFMPGYRNRLFLAYQASY